MNYIYQLGEGYMLGVEGNTLRKVYTGYPYPQLSKSQDELLYDFYASIKNKGVSYDTFIYDLKSEFLSTIKEHLSSNDSYKFTSNNVLTPEEIAVSDKKRYLRRLNTDFDLNLRYYPFLDDSFLANQYKRASECYKSYKKAVEKHITFIFYKKVDLFSIKRTTYITRLNNKVVVSVNTGLDDYIMSFFNPDLLLKYTPYYHSHRGNTIYLDASTMLKGYDLLIMAELINHYHHRSPFLLSQQQKASLCYNLDLDRGYVAKTTLVLGEDSFLANNIKGVFNTNLHPEFNLFLPAIRGNTYYIDISNLKKFHNCFSGKLNCTLLEYLIDNMDYIRYILGLSILYPDYPIVFSRESSINFTLEGDFVKILLK